MNSSLLATYIMFSVWTNKRCIRVSVSVDNKDSTIYLGLIWRDNIGFCVLY